ncbi:MAG TPA: PqqD family protein [Pyrinomonadaceae bacterium]|nr:PqqD family protein [Pyrinomonadaceae bacterium]
MGNTRQTIPAARMDELVIQEVDGETLVYDLKSHKAHCLNRTAATVWKHCDGNQTVDEAARRVAIELRAPVTREVVWLAIDQLAKRGLLKNGMRRAHTVSRRELMRRIGITAAVALPLVTSIMAPTTAQAASCRGIGAFCGGANPPCCDFLVCCDGRCTEEC